MTAAFIERVELIFELDALSPKEAAVRVVDVLDLKDSQVKLYQETMSAQSALARITREGRSSFSIDAAGVYVHFSTIRAYRQQLLSVSMKQECSLRVWEGIVDSFLECKGFTQACLLSDEYTLWQNAVDPLQYQAAGRNCDGLPLVSNGLPSPLHKLVVDTSRNPGRRVIKVGYVEMVGRIMWFAPLFWSLVGVERRHNVLSATDSVEMPNGVVCVFASEVPFIDETTKEVQDDLRGIIFG